MHFAKLFLAGSFAAAAAIRAIFTLATGPLGFSLDVNAVNLTGSQAIGAETVVSFVVGAIIAVRVSGTRVQKAPLN